VPELAEWGAGNLARTAYHWASIRPARPGVMGAPDSAPYDRVLVSADAQRLPQDLVDQLADGGRIVVPVKGTMTLGLRRGDDLELSEHGRYRFVPLL
jgi:protein-L-isoaspartate(D-aspartate) O-methyltransferase